MNSIKIIRSGKVKKAKLYYLRDRTGKSARIAEKIKKKIGIDIETKIQQVSEENVMPASEKDSKAEAPKEEAKSQAPKEEAKEEVKKVETKPAQKKQEQTKEKEEQKK